MRRERSTNHPDDDNMKGNDDDMTAGVFSVEVGVDEVCACVPFGPTVAVNHPDDDDINGNDNDTAVVIGPGSFLCGSGGGRSLCMHSFHSNSCGEPS